MNVVCFGEILLRLSPPGYTRFTQAQSLEMHFGGAEANVAAAVAQLGAESGVRGVLVSTVPDNALGMAAIQFFRACGVDTRFVKRGGERLGLYFVENGAAMRPSQVIYDRQHAAITEIQRGDVDWDEVLRDAAWFHWTGITAALGVNVREQLLEACRTAKKFGVKVSCDLNYRQKLWTPHEAREAMIPLMEYVDVCISNEQDAGICLGVEVEPHGVTEKTVEKTSGELLEDASRRLALQMKAIFRFQAVALSVRSGAASGQQTVPGFITKRALLLDDGECSNGYFSKQYTYQPVEHIGGGDAFTGGLIYGLLTEQSSRAALEIGVAASVIKQTMPGDSIHCSIHEVRQLIQGSSVRSIIR